MGHCGVLCSCGMWRAVGHHVLSLGEAEERLSMAWPWQTLVITVINVSKHARYVCLYHMRSLWLNVVRTGRTQSPENRNKCACARPSSAPSRVVLSLTSMFVDRSCRNSIRILYMPAIYAIISFFSYRFFRSYTYYELVETGASLLSRFCFLTPHLTRCVARSI